MVPNARLSPQFEELSGAEIGARFAQQLAADPAIQMAYGRMDVALDRFFERALLITYRATSDQDSLPAASGSGFVSRSSRYVFRAQVESDQAKRFRWWTESSLGRRDSQKLRYQAFWLLVREAQGPEELRFPTAVRVRGIEKIVDDLVSLDKRQMSVPKLHASALCRG
jgi:hypothetical protein